MDLARFRVPEGKKVSLKDWPTRVDPLCVSKADYKRRLKKQVKELSDLQEVFYADNRHALLLIFQGMDTSGKDSAIQNVMSGVNPQGCHVTSFKHPSAGELAHDFLWRTAQALPERGKIGVFNRSHYEEVLIVRVHPEILLSQRVPGGPLGEGIDAREVREKMSFWDQRYRSIRDFEGHLGRNGTKIVKFFFHLSKEEQRERFLARIDEPDKNWKFSAGDVEERKFWDEYMRAYEDCLGATSTADAPWYVVPADRKADARMIVSAAVLDALRSLKPSYPKVSPQRRQQLQSLRKSLA